MTDNDTIKHWTITTTIECNFTGTQKEAEQLQEEEREYYDSLADGGDVCGYVTGSHLDCDGVLTEEEQAEQYGDHPLATAGD